MKTWQWMTVFGGFHNLLFLGGGIRLPSKTYFLGFWCAYNAKFFGELTTTKSYTLGSCSF